MTFTPNQSVKWRGERATVIECRNGKVSFVMDKSKLLLIKTIAELEAEQGRE
jgi:hypothetical protein